MLTPFGRKIKQINIALGFLTFCLGIAALVWFFVAEPTSIEGEEIKGLEIKDVFAEFQSDDQPSDPPFTYKVSVNIENPNEKFIAKEVAFKIEIKDENGKVIFQKGETTEVKGNEQKKIEKEISIDEQGKNVSFKIVKIKWEEEEND